MKIYFDSVNWNSTSGPNSAVRRIAVQLAYMGHTIADASDYDIALVTIQPTNLLDKSKPYVQRLDGIWSKPQEFATKNSEIRDCYAVADGVVFQSQFDMQMVSKWFGKPNTKNHRVILNGIDIKRTDVNIKTLYDLRQTHETIFVCSSNWHPQKRLHDNIELYKHLRRSCHTNSCLIVMGSNPDKYVADKTIYYTGSQSEDVCLQVFATADWMIHLARTDHCPNVCVQALSQETPIICVDSGGTKEIVLDNGIVLKDVPYNLELEDYDNPPRVPDLDNVKLPDSKSIKIHNDHVNIVDCANSYKELFENVLDTWQQDRKNRQ